MANIWRAHERYHDHSVSKKPKAATRGCSGRTRSVGNRLLVELVREQLVHELLIIDRFGN
jgi:hypothetical protein